MPQISSQTIHEKMIPGTGALAPAAKRMFVLMGAVLALTGCSEAQQAAEAVRREADAAIDAQDIANTVRLSVDEKAIKGAAADALRSELGVVGAVIDEDALVSRADAAVNSQAVTRAIERAARQAAEPPAAE